MSKLAHAGLSSTAPPGGANANADRTAAWQKERTLQTEV